MISTLHSGIPEIIQHGVSGLLAPERDAATLAEHIERLVSQPDSWPEMARAARHTIETQFNVARQNDQLSVVLSELAAAYRAAAAQRRY